MEGLVRMGARHLFVFVYQASAFNLFSILLKFIIFINILVLEL